MEFFFARFTFAGAAAASATPANRSSSIGPYEAAEVVSFPQSINEYGPTLYIIKNGLTLSHQVPGISSGISAPLEPIIVSGPATFQLVGKYFISGLCTIRITPEAPGGISAR